MKYQCDKRSALIEALHTLKADAKNELLAGDVSTLDAAITALSATSPVSGEVSEAVKALRRLERAVDLHLGRSSWTQTSSLKGMGYSEQIRKELFAAHDEARAVLALAGEKK